MLIYVDVFIEKNLLIDNKIFEKIEKSYIKIWCFCDEILLVKVNNKGLVLMWIKIKMCRVNKVMEKRNILLN